MKEELLRVLNTKLNDINANIDSLVELNDKIDNEEKKVSYVRGILAIFKDDSDYNILKFANLNKDDFHRVLDELGEDASKVFNSDSCNYDGLVYLINGINNGVSLSLTDEQKNGIEYLIHGLDEKELDYEASVDGLQLVKARFPISDVNILKEEKEKYIDVLNNLNSNNYVSKTDKVIEAMEYSELSNEEKIKLLSFLLKYNSLVYDERKDTNIVKHDEDRTSLYDEVKQELENSNNESKKEYEEFHFEEFKEPSFDKIESEPITFIAPEENNDGAESVEIKLDDNTKEETSIDQVEINPPVVEEYELEEEPKEEKVDVNNIDDDFHGIVESNEDYEEEKISKHDLQKILKEYGIKDIKDDRLFNGNINNYREVLDTLKKVDLLTEVLENNELLIQMLLNSKKDFINKVLDIAHDDLSVDDEDYEMTKKIVVDTLPLALVGGTNGAYDDFIKNVDMYKKLDINLVNLFDFSKEVLIMDNARIVNNYNLVKDYGIKIDYKNVKYLLGIDNVVDRIDYYVESMYPDKTKNNEIFDGLNFVNSHTSKLNTVCPLTIKRLRYASENGKKVFGPKPNSLSGEITNLKVNALELSDDYLNSFFDNKFGDLTNDEVNEYIKLVQNSGNFGNYINELAGLKQYQKNLRLTINNINVSYNKVSRNYNILRSNGIDKKKALEFAVCYNLIIKKEEYDSLKKFLEELGGNA